MKRLFLTSASLLLAVPDPALALQGPPHGGPPPHQQGGQPGRPPQSKPAPQPRPPQPAPRPPQAKPRPPQPAPHPAPRPPQPAPRPPHARPPGPPPAYRPGQPRPPAYRPIHRPPFVYPHGYSYRRWRVGLALPAMFLSSRYYFNDWLVLGLGPPPPGYYWVRYGPDLLLVRARTGYIVDVIYGAFY